MRIIIKNIIAHILYYTGIVYLLERILLKNCCVVLVYHRITSPEKEDVPVQDGMYVRPEVFEKHLRYLKRRYEFISLDKLLSILNNSGSFNKACHITFDDGWHDNYTNAFPLLRKYHVPATIFLVTDFIGTSEWFWPEKVLYLLRNISVLDIKNDISNELKYILKIYGHKEFTREKREQSIILFLKGQGPQIQEKVVHDLEEISNIEIPKNRQLLTWDEVRDMSKNYISFGSHGRTHVILTSLEDMNEIRHELIESKSTIEAQTGDTVKCFCYPNGNNSPDIIDIAKECGYSCAFGNINGKLGYRDILYNLKRIRIHNDISYNIPMFACRILFNIF